jgi:hypothetical protein
MRKLAKEVAAVMIDEQGTDGLLKRLSDQF